MGREGEYVKKAGFSRRTRSTLKVGEAQGNSRSGWDLGVGNELQSGTTLINHQTTRTSPILGAAECWTRGYGEDEVVVDAVV